MRRAAAAGKNNNVSEQKGSDDRRIVAFLTLSAGMRTDAARLLGDWSQKEGLTLRFASGASPGSTVNPDCRLMVIDVGGRSIGKRAVQRTIGNARSSFPEVPLVIISDLDDRAEVFSAFQSGVQGYIPASLEPEIALQALTFILGGGTYFPSAALASSNGETPDKRPRRTGDRATPAAAPGATETDAGQTGDLLDVLTRRQREVAGLLKNGLTNRTIARRLGVSEATVKVHVRQIMRKLEIDNRTQLALAIRRAASR